MLIFLGWFLSSVQNKRDSSKFIPIILLLLEKFKNSPCNNLVYSSVNVLKEYIKCKVPSGALVGEPGFVSV